MVGVLKQVVGLKNVVRLHPVLGDGLDEVADVFQLEGSRRQSVEGERGGGLRGYGPGVERGKTEPGLTWCQFWVDSLTFFTEPGWSLLMNLQGVREGREKGEPCPPHPCPTPWAKGSDDSQWPCCRFLLQPAQPQLPVHPAHAGRTEMEN